MSNSRFASNVVVRLGRVLAAASLGAGPLAAQTNPPAPPALTVSDRGGVASLKAWPGVDVRTQRDTWVAAFAVSRGKRSLPIQVLTPGKPGKPALLKAGSEVPVRRLDNAEMLHLVNYGQEPVLVVFSSAQPPDLSAFAEGNQWGRDLLIDTLIYNQQEMVDLLGKTLFGVDGEYEVVVRGTREPAPRANRSRGGTQWAFGGGCTEASTSWVRRTGPDGLGLYGSWEGVDPAVRNLAGQSSEIGQMLRAANGAPVTLKGGARVSLLPPTALTSTACQGYRVAWWPRVDDPMPGDTTGIGANGALLPRYPGVDTKVGTQVGTVPAPRVTGNDAAPRSSSIAPRIIVDPAVMAGDGKAIRSLQGVSKPSSDGTVRPPGGD